MKMQIMGILGGGMDPHSMDTKLIIIIINKTLVNFSELLIQIQYFIRKMQRAITSCDPIVQNTPTLTQIGLVERLVVVGFQS
uniref:Peptidyl-prolyl cis-trans isomerase FKBP62-like isoform X2 n=1 Tax=Rhizophora mucronata TaxID=61149 RepID=A0A2P2K2Q4_RHIMU